MKFAENNKEWESFVYLPKKPVAILKDGSWDKEKVQDLILRAKSGEETAQMQLFEQYQYRWKKAITGFVEDMLSYEDAQQEAFYIFMVALQSFDSDDLLAFTGYYQKALVNHLMKLTGKARDEQKEWLYSLDEVDEEGNLLHDVADNTQGDFEQELFPRVKELLTPVEYKIVVAHYHMGIDLKTIAKHYGLTYQYVRLVNAHAKEKLQTLVK